ncbi:alkaline phosphatase family protein [Humisphaera borealis]|uniref:Alkaline phosphatase family protein n=1 Tax=Humisphaera borealis TaxID=2807512 RepID=A0A7M2X2G3_9BACT|nr:ectonucleotide pyrophosphatase/phosphodiesterase [Humisphaera borealis]QOV91938.1 alkaline phosphatase family protein [Humisphaera borealis]
MIRRTLFAMSFALLCLTLIATIVPAADEGGVADGGTRKGKSSTAEREALLATQPAWLRPPTTQASEQAATRPSPHTRPAATPGVRPVAAIQHVLVVSIDGLRPDLLLLADAPNARKLMARGCYSMWAQTTPQSITLPSHVSMLTGMTPNRHGILWNSDIPLQYPLYPGVPTLFEAAKRYGYTVAAVAGKDKFDVFDRRGVLDWRWIPNSGTVKTPAVVGPAVRIIKDHKPDVMLVHFPSVDTVGHSLGWGTPEQIKAIEEADKSLGELVTALDDADLAKSTLLIVSADHGGATKGHGADDARSRHIPWIAVGPGLRKGYDLTREPKLNVKTEDTFATACWALGIPPLVANLDGTPVKAIIAPKTEELLQPAKVKVPTEW